MGAATSRINGGSRCSPASSCSSRCSASTCWETGSGTGSTRERSPERDGQARQSYAWRGGTRGVKMDLHELKAAAAREVDRLGDRIRALALRIHDNPELSFEE